VFHDRFNVARSQMLGMHGTVAANFAVDRADLLLAIGVRFDDRVTGKLEAFAARARIVHVDIDPAEINKNKASHVTVCADAKPSLQVTKCSPCAVLMRCLGRCSVCCCVAGPLLLGIFNLLTRRKWGLFFQEPDEVQNRQLSRHAFKSGLSLVGQVSRACSLLKSASLVSGSVCNFAASLHHAV
jgi:hypothetical protein